MGSRMLGLQTSNLTAYAPNAKTFHPKRSSARELLRFGLEGFFCHRAKHPAVHAFMCRHQADFATQGGIGRPSTGSKALYRKGLFKLPGQKLKPENSVTESERTPGGLP